MSLQDGAKGAVHIIQRLIPPTDGDPWSRFRYDLAVSLSIVIGGAFVAFHVLWICGLLVWLGIDAPFARAAEFDDYKARIVSLQRSQLESEIRSDKKQFCLATQAKNQAALEAWARELESAINRYQGVMGQYPRVMGCDELLIGGAAQQ